LNLELSDEGREENGCVFWNTPIVYDGCGETIDFGFELIMVEEAVDDDGRWWYCSD